LPASEGVSARGAAFTLIAPLVLSGYGRAGATPRTRTLACESSEQLAEMSLVGQPAIRGDLPEGCVGQQHQTLRALHSPSHHIGMRHFAQAIPENAAEVEGAQSDEGGEIARSEGRVQVGLDVRGEAADLRWSQAPANSQGAARFR
jgi:hypothetical protein